MRKNWPLYVAKRNEKVELACHMFGAPLKLTKDRKWFVGSSESLDNANNNNLDDTNSEQRQSFLLSSSNTGVEDVTGQDKRSQAAGYDAIAATTTLEPLTGSLGGNSFAEPKPEGEEDEREGEGEDDDEDDQDDRASAGELFVQEDSVSNMMSPRLNELDLVSIIFWFKDDNPIPIYTLDARQMQANGLIPKPTTNSERDLDKKSRYATAANNTATNHRHHHHYHNKKDAQETISSGSGNGNSNNNDNSEIAKIMHTNVQLLSGARHYRGSRRGDSTTVANVNSSLLKLDPISSFPVIKLTIEGAGPRDSGNYKCRVDFRRSSTISQIVRLLVEGE